MPFRVPNLNPSHPQNIIPKGFLQHLSSCPEEGGYGGWGQRWSLGDARPLLALDPEITILGPPPRKFHWADPKMVQNPSPTLCPGSLKGGVASFLPHPTSPPQLALLAHPLPSTQGPALSPGDRYLEDTHSQRCMFLQLAVLAGGLGGLPSQAVFVPPAAQVLMDRQTNWQQDKEAQGPLDDYHPPLANPSSPMSHTSDAHLLGITVGRGGETQPWPLQEPTAPPASLFFLPGSLLSPGTGPTPQPCSGFSHLLELGL